MLKAREIAATAIADHPGGAQAGPVPWLTCDVPAAKDASLQEKVLGITKAENEVKTLVERMRNDPSLGPRSERAERVGTLEGALDYIVSETKKSGLYGNLQQAAVERLKASGNYEDLIRKILEKEASMGSTRDRAWAEDWIEGQFDYDRVDANHDQGMPYFELRATYGEVRPRPGNQGSAAFFGNKSDVHAQGAFAIEFSGSTERPLYTVENRLTGEKSAPRPFDVRGTVIEADGLRAEMFGAPAPGDVFSIFKPSRGASQESDYYVGYPDSMFTSSAHNRKVDLFNNLFAPSTGADGEKSPISIVRQFLYTPV
ncbi:hypothetical protein AKI39_07030 [Bordetella sp. H567]|nr:hypothetical protein AKI39_07030 [Bordetella sp. H567]